MRFRKGAWLALLWLGWTAQTQALEERPLAEGVYVDAGATCVTAASLVPQITAWLGTDRVDAQLQVRIVGSALDPRDVTMEIRRGAELVGERHFQPAPFVCEQLEATLALAVAMALKASLRDELLDTLGGTNRAATRDALGVLVRGGTGVLPGGFLGFGLTTSRAFGTGLALRAEVFADAARNAGLKGTPGKFDSLLLSAQVSGCALLPAHRAWAGRACIGLALGALQARGRGYAESHTDWLPWIAATNSFAFSVRLFRAWWLELPAGLVIPLNKLHFGVRREDGSVAESRMLPRFGFSVALGPVYHF